MILVTRPKYFHVQLQGQIIMEYKGKNEDAFGRVVCRDAHLMMHYTDASNSTWSRLVFTIDFQEFYGLAMQLNFTTNKVLCNTRSDDSLADVGTIQLERICPDEQSFVITGQYTHESISLAYHNDDIVNFQVCFDIRIAKPRFNHERILETFQHFPHLDCVTRFYH